MAQDASTPDVSAVDQYTQVLEEIANRRTTLLQREFYLQQQQAEIDALSAQIATAGEADASEELLPLVREMVAEIEKRMVSDLPFRVERRFALLDDLRDDLQNDNVLIADTYRRAMELYIQEVTYGYQVGSYQGLNPIADRAGRRYAACEADVDSAACDLSDEQRRALNGGAELEDLREQIYDGNYIHYGRMALLYLERDSSEGYRYNEASQQWDELTNSELLGLRQNVRIARGESAIGTMVAPIRVGEAGADAS
ncbi:MAG: DUF3450 family protein [Litorimonas sp.]